MYIRTAWNIIEQGGDFRELVTTRKWQVNTAILLMLAYTERPNQTLGRSYLGFTKYEDQFRAFSHLTEADYSDWRTVELTQATTPYPYENTPDMAEALRNIADGDTMALVAPRVGFFSTPAFYGTWVTNDDNQFRLTTQQSLIVALDFSFTPSDSTPHLTEDGIPLDHADPDTTCYQCHRHMDPMRSIFSNFQNTKHRARTTAQTLQASFSVLGVSQNMTTPDDFAQLLVNHPRFPGAWVQKLCMWGNAQRCDEADTEFIRLAQFFEHEDFNFQALVAEFFSSPLFNATQSTQTHTKQEYLISKSRGNHFCHALRTRATALRAENGFAVTDKTSHSVKMCSGDDFGLITADAFARGEPSFVQNAHISPFDTKSIDRSCLNVTRQVFINGDNKLMNEGAPVAQNIQQLVEYIMGVPSLHPRHDLLISELTRAYNIARHPTACTDVDPAEQGDEIHCGYNLGHRNAINTAWLLACSSPELNAIGL